MVKNNVNIQPSRMSVNTITLESLMLSCLIDYMQNQDIITVEVRSIPAGIMDNKLMHLRLYGKMAELLIRISTYEPYMCLVKGKPTLSLRLSKELYGTLRAAYLFWKNFQTIHVGGVL